MLFYSLVASHTKYQTHKVPVAKESKNIVLGMYSKEEEENENYSARWKAYSQHIFIL